MNRRALAVASCVGCAGLAGSLLVTAGGAQQQTAPTGTLELVTLDREDFFRFVDNPPRQGERRPPGPGDLGIIRLRLRDTSNRPVGRAGLVAVHLASSGETQLSETFKVSGGQITVHGESNIFSRRPSTFAITGGTGIYEGAKGTLTVTSGRTSRRYVFDFGP